MEDNTVVSSILSTIELEHDNFQLNKDISDVKFRAVGVIIGLLV